MGVISRTLRKKTATIVEHTKGPRGGETHYRFPMSDKPHARNALQRLPLAKNLSDEERAQIRARANRMLYGKTEKPYRLQKKGSRLKVVKG
jgi:hypothetical protein